MIADVLAETGYLQFFSSTLEAGIPFHTLSFNDFIMMYKNAHLLFFMLG